MTSRSEATHLTRVATDAIMGFEPTPLRNGALSHCLRPLGQTVLEGSKTYEPLCENRHLFLFDDDIKKRNSALRNL